MTDRELLEVALCALLNYPQTEGKAIEALRTRLAQPESEPLEYWNAVEGWVNLDEVRQHLDLVNCGTIYKSAGENRVPLYTAAPPKKEWVWLTHEEIIDIWAVVSIDYDDEINIVELGKAIDAKLKEKNNG